MFSFLREYRHISKPVLLIILAEFFVQFVNSTFMNLQPLYMKAEGYSDPQIADIISWRFAGVLLLALPLGIWIRGRRLRNFFFASAVGVPAFALLILLFTHLRMEYPLLIAQFLWGTSFSFIQIAIIPFILRNLPTEQHTPAIVLSVATWSLAGIVSAVLVWILNSANPVLFSERNMMVIVSVLSFAGIFCVRAGRLEENINQFVKIDQSNSYDWKLILKALVPALVIATGAGLTIPFINLFFSRVHHLPTNTISLWNFLGALLVASAGLLVPKIKKHIGYSRAIPLTQSLAVVALVLLATTEWYAHLTFAAGIAIACYMLRQPLMNLAGPMTSELGMKYVGQKNQEMTSALISAVWSGSWFISTRFIFGNLRDTGWPYVSIFLITAALYAVGVLLYVLLIRSYDKRIKNGEITSH